LVLIAQVEKTVGDCVMLLLILMLKINDSLYDVPKFIRNSLTVFIRDLQSGQIV
jgi:hypothetical protein